MSLSNFVDALHVDQREQTRLKPENWITMDVFRNYIPDWVSSGMPAPGSSGNDRKEEKLNALAGVLAGEKVPDALLEELFGFNNAQLEAQLKAADPVIKPIPDHLVLLTFDDSTIDHYTIAAPVMEQYGFHGIFYTTEMLPGPAMMGGWNPGFDDKTRYMTWEQIRDLSDRGHEIGNHTLHHDLDFPTSSDEAIRAAVVGLEEECAKHGVPKPINMGYPGGYLTQHNMDMMHQLGYYWGRGSQTGAGPLVVGDAWYDPYLHTPLCIPNHMAMNKEKITAAIEGAVNGKIAQFVYHEVTDGPMMQVPFAEQMKLIADLGGKAITTRELMEYVDPVKAWNYIYPVQPEQPKRGPLPGAPKPGEE